MFQMLSHGIVSAALFLCVGVVYDRLHTREIDRYGGLVKNMPNYAVAFMLFAMASIGLPGTSGFVGEFLVLVGSYQVSTMVTALAATGVVLGAAYTLLLYKRVVFGELVKPDVRAMKDLSAREVMIFAPMIVLVLWMGIYPSSFTRPMAPSLAKVITDFKADIAQPEAQP
jgi:NADH-quinone oxidoreductase subunit M